MKISYTDYLKENIDKSIVYSEYIAEHIDDNITYSEYITEHLDKNIEPDTPIGVSGEKLKAHKNYIEESILKNIDGILKIGYKIGSYENQLIKARNAARAINRQRQIDCIFENTEFIPMLIQDTEEYTIYTNWYSGYICDNSLKNIYHL